MTVTLGRNYFRGARNEDVHAVLLQEMRLLLDHLWLPEASLICSRQSTPAENLVRDTTHDFLLQLRP